MVNLNRVLGQVLVLDLGQVLVLVLDLVDSFHYYNQIEQIVVGEKDNIYYLYTALYFA